MRMLMFAMLIILAGSSFAQLSDAYKTCSQTCCVNSGGTYLWDSNGCESPGPGESECVMSTCKLDENQTHQCPIGLVLLSLVGAVGVVKSVSGKKNA
jgi:hypothetical protein